MSLYPSTVRLSPLLVLYLLCLPLLFTGCSSVGLDPPLIQPNPTQANCTANCSSTTAEPVRNVKPTPSAGIAVTTTLSATTPTTQQSTTAQATSPSATTQQPTTTRTTTTLSASTVTTTVPPPNTTTSATSTTTTRSTATTTTASPTTTQTTTLAAAAAPGPATTIQASTTTPTRTPSITTPTSSSVATQQPKAPTARTPPPIQTSSLTTGPSTITLGGDVTPGHRNEPVTSGTKVAMVEVAGAPLTSQLVDTASLLAVLLFGLLFFLVTVAVFVGQAYESYRRKDYTQVDYLINGMYTDSGV